MAVAQEQKTLSLTLKRIAKVVKFCQIGAAGATLAPVFRAEQNANRMG